MGADFTIMERHLDAPRASNPGGKLVLSRLKPGSSVIGAAAPSLKLVTDGEEIYEVDGRPLRVVPGQFLYLGPGAHCIGTNRTETTGLCLMLPYGAAGCADGDDSCDDPVLGRALVLSTRTSSLGRTFAEAGRQIARDPALGARVAGQLVAGVAAAIEEPLGASRAAIEGLKAAKRSTRRELFQRLERARGHLHANDDRPVALAELADVAGLSQFHLARFFKLAFGAAPIAYHRALRLARAAALLSAGGGTVAEAAEAAGYSDQVSLSHAFRKRYGLPPRHWATARRAG